MKILITGGAGFIGSHITGHLLQNGHEVICLDSFDEYYDPVIKRQNIESFLSFDNFTLIEGDITDQLLLQDAMEGCDYVFHQAAQAGVRISVENPMLPHITNTSGTLAVLKAACDAGVKKLSTHPHPQSMERSDTCPLMKTIQPCRFLRMVSQSLQRNIIAACFRNYMALTRSHFDILRYMVHE